VDEVVVGFMTSELDASLRDDERGDDAARSLLDELMTSRQVAALLHMRLSTVEAYARRGLLPSVKVGRHRRFVRSQVERALTALTAAAGHGK
jgi:excisionase family DNA binding protein